MTACFWTEPTGRAIVYLRRYVRLEAPCQAEPSYGYHNARRFVGYAVSERYRSADGHDLRRLVGFDEPEHSDPRWPTSCACGYEFVDEDHWQVAREEEYRTADDRRGPFRDLPVGAMYDAWWWAMRGVGLDGIALTIVCPPGGLESHWHVDGPATGSDGRWTRSGTIPIVTATPSIQTGQWHGWLTNGQLIPA